MLDCGHGGASICPYLGYALVAQPAEHHHGKVGVIGSNPIEGFPLKGVRRCCRLGVYNGYQQKERSGGKNRIAVHGMQAEKLYNREESPQYDG